MGGIQSMAENQTQRIRVHADRLVERFLGGHAAIDTNAPLDSLQFRFKQSDLDLCPDELRPWAEGLARNNLELFHFHAFQWLAKGVEPPGCDVKRYCERYVTLRQQLDNKK